MSTSSGTKLAKLSRILLGTVLGLAAGTGMGIGLRDLAPFISVALESESTLNILIYAAAGITLVTAIVITKKTEGGFGTFIASFFGGWISICIFGVIIYYSVPVLLNASNVSITIFIGITAVICGIIGALIARKKNT